MPTTLTISEQNKRLREQVLGLQQQLATANDNWHRAEAWGREQEQRALKAEAHASSVSEWADTVSTTLSRENTQLRETTQQQQQRIDQLVEEKEQLEEDYNKLDQSNNELAQLYDEESEFVDGLGIETRKLLDEVRELRAYKSGVEGRTS
ncbi:uncharacterized protein BKA78DRAFT_311283 [Phyllosticta capitalensis]|uniref:uncharacterized protein n=1 Tax=Phyllosticta capitalensis TaxID=121624 RepID=UPI0031311B23